MIRIRLHDTEASLEQGIWTSDYDQLVKLLNAVLFDTSSPSIPDPDLALAEHVIAKLGGEIIHADPPEPMLDGVVY